ncbi:MAG TPA: serine/threonine protein phosphatase [Verrucomicrobia bacterium]|nr:serine/threonine protein phosphatase [Verrucomicrobiota bacterium]
MLVDQPVITRLDEQTDDGAFAIGAVTRSLANDPYCGDHCAWWEHAGNVYLFLADGLGHGQFAHQAATAALDSLRRQSPAELTALFTQCDQDIRHTRGVALGVAVIDPGLRTLAFCGVGNIRALMINQDQRQRHFTCGYGIVGAGFKNLRVETLPFMPGDTLIMASDGILEHFVAADDPPDARWSAMQLSEQILGQWAIATDDAAVLTCRTRLAE